MSEIDGGGNYYLGDDFLAFSDKIWPRSAQFVKIYKASLCEFHVLRIILPRLVDFLFLVEDLTKVSHEQRSERIGHFQNVCKLQDLSSGTSVIKLILMTPWYMTVVYFDS